MVYCNWFLSRLIIDITFLHTFNNLSSRFYYESVVSVVLLLKFLDQIVMGFEGFVLIILIQLKYL